MTLLRPMLLAAMLAQLVLPCSSRAQEQSVSFQGVDRHFLLHLPSHPDGPVPLVVGLPGLGESPEELQASWTLDAVADRERFAVLYPAQLGDRWSYTPARAVKLPDGTELDDVGFILRLVDQLVAYKIADPARIFVAGVSNGGLMAFTLVCRAPERFAAVAALITGMLEEQAEACHPAKQVPLMMLAGTMDYDQFYDGALGPNYRLMSVPETTEFWRKQRGCLAKQLTVAPVRTAADQTQAVMIDWSRCADPALLRFWRIDGAGHSLPSFRPLSDGEHPERPRGGRSQTIETAEEVWRFFQVATASH